MTTKKFALVRLKQIHNYGTPAPNNKKKLHWFPNANASQCMNLKEGYTWLQVTSLGNSQIKKMSTCLREIQRNISAWLPQKEAQTDSFVKLVVVEAC